MKNHINDQPCVSYYDNMVFQEDHIRAYRDHRIWSAQQRIQWIDQVDHVCAYVDHMQMRHDGC